MVALNAVSASGNCRISLITVVCRTRSWEVEPHYPTFQLYHRMLLYCSAILISKKSKQGMFLLCCFYSTLPKCLFPFPRLHMVLSRAIASLLSETLHTWSICCLWLLLDISSSSYLVFISNTLVSNFPCTARAFSCCFCEFIYADELARFNILVKP